MPLTFDAQTGLLTSSPALHEAEPDEIRQHLVDEFPSSTQRPMIWDAYLQHRRSLRAVDGGDEQEQWLDGSFARKTENPGDLDFVTFVPDPVIAALSPTQEARLRALFQGKRTRPDGLLDSYLVPIEFDEAGNEIEATRQARDYWRKQFGRERDGTAKGIIRTWVGDEDA